MRNLKLSLVALSFAVGMSAVAGEVVADAAQTVVDQCHTQALLETSEQCACMGEHARTELTPLQQELVAARMTVDAETEDSLIASMPEEDVAVTDGWVENTAATCSQS